MKRIRAAAFLFVSNHDCVGIGETPDADRESLAHEIEVANLPADTCEGEDPRLALVDDPRSPTEWRFVMQFYRVWVASFGYEAGTDNFFERFDEAVVAAQSLVDVGYDCRVHAFNRPGDDAGRVVWGS